MNKISNQMRPVLLIGEHNPLSTNPQIGRHMITYVLNESQIQEAVIFWLGHTVTDFVGEPEITVSTDRETFRVYAIVEGEST